MKPFFLLVTFFAAIISLSAAPLPVLEVPKTQIAPKLEAAPDDDAWKRAATLSALPLALGSDARDVPFPTTVKLLHDGAFLYIRFECQAREIYAPFDKPDRDQPLWTADAVEVFLDVVGDGKQVVELQLSPKNQVFDQQILLTGEPKSDEFGKLRDEVLARDFWTFRGWNLTEMKTVTRAAPDGWVGEFALPAAPLLKRLNLKSWDGQTIRTHLMRYSHVPDAGEKRRLVAQNWAPHKHGCPHISPAAMGFLKLAN